MNFFKLSLLVISLFAFSSCAQLSSNKNHSCCTKKSSCTLKGKCKPDKSCCKDECKSCDGKNSCSTGACDLKKE